MKQLKTIEKELEKLAKDDKDRLGLCYVRMNQFEWDREIFGVPVKGYDHMSQRQKYENNKPVMGLIYKYLSEQDMSMYWWLLELHQTKEAWEQWYFSRKETQMEHNI